mgnify:CR=1 FL=1
MTSNSILVKRKVCPTCLGSNFETIKEISYSNNQLINFIRQQYDLRFSLDWMEKRWN